MSPVETPTPLLFDSISRNTGDRAIGLAAAQLLSRHGIETTVPGPFAQGVSGPAVVSGGELIRESGDGFYDAFRRTGPHILNAAGVWTSADDLDYLNEYAFVSARSSRELEVLQRSVPTAELVPCATTLLESPAYTMPDAGDEPMVGIHLVPHALRLIEDLVDIVDAIPYRKVFIPFTHYNADRSFMSALPFDMSNAVLLNDLGPLELHSIIGQLEFLIATSLHASIFAFSQNVPFASIAQKKVALYFADRNLSDHVVDSGRALRGLLERIDADGTDFTEQIAADRAAIESAFSTYADIIRASEPAPAPFQYPRPSLESPDQAVSEVLTEQPRLVIRDRDLSISTLEARRRRHVDELAAERAEHRSVSQELASTRAALELRTTKLQEAEEQLERLRSHWYVRAAESLGNLLGRLLRR